jgi:acyl carrier protein
VEESLAHVLGKPAEQLSLSPDSRILDELGLDSLQVINFLLEVEDRLQVQIDVSSLQIDDLKTVDAFLGYLDKVSIPV